MIDFLWRPRTTRTGQMSSEGALSLLIWLGLQIALLIMGIKAVRGEGTIYSGFLLSALVMSMAIAFVVHVYAAYPTWLYFALLYALCFNEFYKKELKV